MLHYAWLGIGNTTAFALAIPLGIVYYLDTDQTDMINFIRRQYADYPEQRDRLLRERIEFQRTRGGIGDYIGRWYDNLKPREV